MPAGREDRFDDTHLDTFGWLEWEILREPLEMTDVEDTGDDLPDGIEKVSVFRDDDYGIVGSVHARPDELYRPFDPEETRRFVEGFEIQTEGGRMETRLKGCYVRRFETEQFTPGRTRHPEVTIEVRPRRLQRRRTDADDTSWRSEWFINGLKQGWIFTDTTERNISIEYARNRQGVEGGDVEADAETGPVRKDYFSVEGEDLEFTVQKVPDAWTPEWCRPISLEYREEWDGGIPDAETRRKVRDFVSFGIGRRLLKVGHTEYDSDGHLIEEEAIQPGAGSPRLVCGQQSRSPFGVPQSPRNQIGSWIGQLLPEYLRCCDELGLDETLWLFWAGETLPVGADLPLYYAGLNGLATRYFSSGFGDRSPYIDKERYRQAMEDIFPQIEDALGSLDGPEDEPQPVIDYINHRAYQKGTGREIRDFFESLELPIGATERAAMEERHKWAHGRIPDADDGYKRVMLLGDAYWSLLFRVFLKILGHESPYQDMTQAEMVRKPVEEPVGPLELEEE